MKLFCILYSSLSERIASGLPRCKQANESQNFMRIEDSPAVRCRGAFVSVKDDYFDDCLKPKPSGYKKQEDWR